MLDITDTYFAGSGADWKARRGKDGKYEKLIQIALAVTTGSFDSEEVRYKRT